MVRLSQTILLRRFQEEKLSLLKKIMLGPEEWLHGYKCLLLLCRTTKVYTYKLHIHVCVCVCVCVCVYVCVSVCLCLNYLGGAGTNLCLFNARPVTECDSQQSPSS